MNLNIIYNRNIQGIIGINGNLLLGIKEDFQWFKEHTINNIVVMGYNTFIDLPGKGSINPLKDRLNIIISENHYNELNVKIKENNVKGVIVYKNFKDFYDQWVPNKCNNYQKFYEINKGLYDPYLDKYKSVTDIFIIGGSTLYKHVFNSYKIDSIYETLSDIRVDFNILNNNSNKISYFNNIIPTDKYTNIYSKNVKGSIRLNFEKDHPVYKDGIYTFKIYHHNDNINKGELVYLRLLDKVSKDGISKDARNSRVISLFSPPSMKFDLRKGFPLLTSKKMPWKIILKELLWFISGSTDNRILQSKGVHIWDGNASKEYMEKRGLSHYPEGDLGPIYGFQWRHFGAKYYGCSVKHDGRGFDQLKYIIKEINDNPNSRRIILNSWNASDLDLMALPPCHVMVQFNVDSKEKYIDAKLIQRSGDMFLGVPFNIASYSFLLHIIGNITGYTPRYLIHDIGDAHIYNNHIEAINVQLQRKMYPFPELIIKRKIDNIDEIDESDFDIIKYSSYPLIRAKMIA